MNVISIKDEGNKRTIYQRGTRPQQCHSFFKAIFQAWEEGYTLPENPTRDQLSTRNYRGVVVGRCVLFKGAPDGEITNVEPEQVVQEDVDTSTDTTNAVEDKAEETIAEDNVEPDTDGAETKEDSTPDEGSEGNKAEEDKKEAPAPSKKKAGRPRNKK